MPQTREMHSRILGPSTGIWRSRFEANYELPAAKSMEELEHEYKSRAIILSRRMDFRGRKTNLKEQAWLEVIHTMLVESLTIPIQPSGPKTYNRLREVMSQSNFLSRPKKQRSCEFTCAIQLSLTSLALHREVSEPCSRYDYELAIAYSFGSEANGPYITHNNLDLIKLLHIRSFWQRHLLEPEEMSFYLTFKDLAEDHKPKMRKGYGATESELSSSWIGYYSCLHPMPQTRTQLNKNPGQTCADIASHLIDILSLDLQTTGDEFWPVECNNFIPMSEDPDIHRVFFQGSQGYYGQTSDLNPVFGFKEDISFPYGGIPGWARICFAIIATGQDINSSDWVHGYEAILLPGGRIMMGRWLDLKEPSGRGPFIFWDVEVPFYL
ncbi:hypothetical protein N7509_003704 [Penicillium cosmopolitanum]|uniref:Uncharacterized protein n=1 Tax=Penicillium cosmopolitanum TaxID=1131564 RepID=A0A9W9W5I4_9EURO|nr:uncharacterized protein N7509_003704 [Penicillium cosmopolitanum]KAJ5403833.1 hypothetical protein N7509_003704 [Penicillium cosmopolitanum]